MKGLTVLRWWGLALGALLMSAYTVRVSAQVAEFNPVDNTLTMPLVRVDGVLRSNVKINVPPGQPMAVVSSGTQSSIAPTMGVPTYSSVTTKLVLPYLKIAGTTYYDVQLSVPISGGNWNLLQFQQSDPAVAEARGLARSASTDPGVPDWAAAYGVTFPYNQTIANKYAGDDGGLLTYVMANGDIWRITADDPCFPQNAATAAESTGTSNVMIVPNATTQSSNTAGTGDMIMVISYTTATQAEVESCLVTPVQIGGQFVPPYQDIATSVGSISGSPGDEYAVEVRGGTQPYSCSIDKEAVATSARRDSSDSTNTLGRTYDITLKSVGSASLTCFDFYQHKTTVTIASAVSTAAITVLPSAISAYVGDTINVILLDGTAPYQSPVISNSSIAEITSSPGATNTTQFSVKMLAVGTTNIYVLDSVGRYAAIAVTVGSLTSVTDTATTDGTSSRDTTGTDNGSSVIFK